jgi:hypothetical protein
MTSPGGGEDEKHAKADRQTQFWVMRPGDWDISLSTLLSATYRDRPEVRMKAHGIGLDVTVDQPGGSLCGWHDLGHGRGAHWRLNVDGHRLTWKGWKVVQSRFS